MKSSGDNRSGQDTGRDRISNGVGSVLNEDLDLDPNENKVGFLLLLTHHPLVHPCQPSPSTFLITLTCLQGPSYETY